MVLWRARGYRAVTVLERAEPAPNPTALLAPTRNLYAVPLTSPVTVRLVAPAAAGRRASIRAPVVALTTRTEYPVIAEPPLAGAVKRTSAEAFPAVGVGVAGVA